MSKFSIKKIQQIITSVEEELAFNENNLWANKTHSTVELSSANTYVRVKDVLKTHNELLCVYYYLRNIVKHFNYSLNIDIRTSEIASLEKQNNLLNTIVERGQPHETNMYSSKDTSYSEGLSLDSINEFRSTIKQNKRKIQELKDSCAGTNNQRDIEIDKTFIDILKKYALID